MCARHAPTLVALILSFGMTGLISLAVTGWNVGLSPALLAAWPVNWAVAWAMAFPAIRFSAPRVQRFVQTRLVKPC